MLKRQVCMWMVACVALSLAGPSHRVSAADPVPGEMAGYLLVPNERVDPAYNAGFSMYVATWSLFDEYPGWESQTGLFGTWMHNKGETHLN